MATRAIALNEELLKRFNKYFFEPLSFTYTLFQSSVSYAHLRRFNFFWIGKDNVRSSHAIIYLHVVCYSVCGSGQTYVYSRAALTLSRVVQTGRSFAILIL